MLLCLPPAAGAELAERDDRGSTITLAAPAARIVVLAPHLAELAFAAGAGARVVGAVRYSDYPSVATQLPQVGDSSRVNIERVLQLQPDLVLAWSSGNQASDIARLERLGFAVFVVEPRRLTDVSRHLRVVGRLAGHAVEASRAADIFDNKIKYLYEKHRDRPAVRVFYEIWHRPLITVSSEHMIDDVLRLCGGRNVFAQSLGLTPTVPLESVLAARPEVILGGSSAGGPGAFAAQWRGVPVRQLREIPAFYVEPDLIQRATPRIAEGALAICRHLEGIRGQRTGGGARPVD